MRLTLLRMISNGSLSAFSASVAHSLPARQDGVQRVRALGTGQPGGSTQNARPGFQAAPVAPAPGQILPRGSLLDLSV